MQDHVEGPGRPFGGAVAVSLLAGVTMLIGGEAAVAATTAPEVETISLGPASGTGQQDLSFDLFDSSLGTLTGVTFELESEVTATVNIQVLPGTGGETYNATGVNNSRFKVSTGLTGGTPIFDATFPVDASCAAQNPPDCHASDALADPTLFSGTYPVPGGLAAFLGSGTFLAMLDFANQLSTTICQNENGPQTCSVTGTAGWSGTLSLTYTYTLAETGGGEVPEPVGLSLLGIGLLGLVAARRRAR